MSAFLLDANVLIALTVVEHEHHERASTWFADMADAVLSPVVKGALVRFLVRLGESPRTATQVLEALHSDERVTFEPDALSYRDVDLTALTGHQQVTNAYLARLARSSGRQLATFDVGLTHAHPDVAFLIP